MPNRLNLFIAVGIIVALSTYAIISLNVSTVLDEPHQQEMTKIIETGNYNDAVEMVSQQGKNISSTSNLSSNVAELQTEIIKLRNQIDPRNISEAFQPGQTHSVAEPNDTYTEMKEGTIAKLPVQNKSK